MAHPHCRMLPGYPWGTQLSVLSLFSHPDSRVHLLPSHSLMFSSPCFQMLEDKWAVQRPYSLLAGLSHPSWGCREQGPCRSWGPSALQPPRRLCAQGVAGPSCPCHHGGLWVVWVTHFCPRPLLLKSMKTNERQPRRLRALQHAGSRLLSPGAVIGSRQREHRCAILLGSRQHTQTAAQRRAPAVVGMAESPQGLEESARPQQRGWKAWPPSLRSSSPGHAKVPALLQQHPTNHPGHQPEQQGSGFCICELHTACPVPPQPFLSLSLAAVQCWQLSRAPS